MDRRDAYFECFCPVRLVAGPESLSALPGLLANLGAHRPLIVTAKRIAAAGLTRLVTEELARFVEIGGVFDEVTSDADTETAVAVARRWREQECDALVAVGGNAVLDTAKAANVLVSCGGEDLFPFGGIFALPRSLKPLVAVPTTAAAGFEVTPITLPLDLRQRRRPVIVSPRLIPDAAVIDPRVTAALPPSAAAETGMAAMAHAVEAYVGRGRNPLSDAYCLEAVRLISVSLVQAARRPDDEKARLSLVVAATLSGLAFAGAMAGMVHVLSSAITAVCGIPQGQAAAILLPYGLEYNRHRCEAAMDELLFPMGGPEVYARTARGARTDRVISFIRQLNQDLYLTTNGAHPRAFRDCLDRSGNPAVPPDCLAEAARAALDDGVLLYNPEAMDEDDALMVLEAAWQGVALDSRRIRRG